jgi:hypothetical protein
MDYVGPWFELFFIYVSVLHGPREPSPWCLIMALKQPGRVHDIATIHFQRGQLVRSPNALLTQRVAGPTRRIVKSIDPWLYHLINNSHVYVHDFPVRDTLHTFQTTAIYSGGTCGNVFHPIYHFTFLTSLKAVSINKNYMQNPSSRT